MSSDVTKTANSDTNSHTAAVPGSILRPFDPVSAMKHIQDIAPSLTYTNPLGLGNLIQNKSIEVKWIESAMDSCATKALVSGVAGWGLGVAFGLLTAGMDPSISGADLLGTKQLKSTRDVLSFMKSRAGSYGRNFGSFGMLFMAIECMLEYQRASTDLMNTAMAGCLTGGAIGLRAGGMAGLGGCAGVAGFSLALDYFWRFS
ncbi:Mitochondrial import inner membrane translocase subunit Tim22 [Oopsacas minuta]|uniref:Mitochondrial import inner membrane translocase subunit TIM22 n=1 Tax=Oopsacas minuta TaxID=111878 RepID=A0AAV7JNR1_9METZ|nr:Mitochondrial import inner membrane translocase subunit Tim22 [Oopsacas minuta]